VEPAPRWVVPAAEAGTTFTPTAAMHYRVIDNQLLVDEKSVDEYNHVVRVVDNATGLSAASQIELEFDPSYQTLALHNLQIVRDGKRLNRLDRTRIRLLQREAQLERRMYDGRVTMSIVLEDVRIGDQVDFAYTVRGANPVFSGKFVHTAWMSTSRGPAALYQLRLLAPAKRVISQRVGPTDAKTESRILGEMRETIFRRKDVPQLATDAGASYSAFLSQQIQFSEFSDWREVAKWGQTLFTVGGTQELVDKKAADIKAGATDPTARLLAALDFVQKDVRYFGTEIGINSHRPALPDKVIEQRFGDCKDKVGLLVALLNRLDIPATPVLVSTLLHGEIERLSPTPDLFDHVIARVDLDGKTYWLDGTRSHQTGTLSNRQSVDFAMGLPLDASTASLASMPTPYDSVRMIVADRIRIDRFASDPTLESRVTFRGNLAELYREALASQGLADVGTNLATPYLKTYPKAKSVAPIQVDQSSDDDAITFVQTFSIPDFWRFPEQRALVADIVHWSTLQAISLPKAETRKDAYAFQFPGVYRQVISIDFPEDVYRTGESHHFEDSYANVFVKGSLDATHRGATYTTEARIAADALKPSDWTAYASTMNKLMPRLTTVAAVPAITLERSASLNARFKDEEAAIRAKKVKAQTRVQLEALFKNLVLSAEIESGRLSPALEAQARNARGIQLDNLGHPDKALDDFVQALVLAPDADDIRNAAAVNAIQRRNFDQAIELASGVLKHNASDAEALNSRALANYFKTQFHAAESDLNTLLKDESAIRRGYPIIWLSLTMRHEGLDPSALEQRYQKEQLPAAWPRPLVDLATGKATVDSVIEAAKQEKNPAESLCEAYFYIGEKYRAEGDSTRAVDYWRKSVEQGIVEFVEHAAAQYRLATALGN